MNSKRKIENENETNKLTETENARDLYWFTFVCFHITVNQQRQSIENLEQNLGGSFEIKLFFKN